MDTPASTTKTNLSPQYKQQTLVLRQKAKDMQANIEAKLQERVEEFKAKRKDCSDEEIDAQVKQDVKDEDKEQLEKMDEEEKSHAPQKPAKTESISFEEFKQKHNDCSDEDINAFVDQAFGDVENEVQEQLEKMKEEVKSHAPKKPVKTESMSDEEFKEKEEQYQKDKAAYIEYVGYVTRFLKGLAKLFADICKKIREFFRNLWNWVKQAFKDIAKRVSDFVVYLKDLFSTGIEALFG